MTIKVIEISSIRYMPISFKKNENVQNIQIPFLLKVF